MRTMHWFILILAHLFCELTAKPDVVAIGNLAEIFRGEGFFSTVEHPLKGFTKDLWCAATKNRVLQDIANAKFIRVHDRKEFSATLDDQNKKAILILGTIPITEASKYRCEITTKDGDLAFGNLFAYAHPVIHVNDTWDAHVPDPERPDLIEARRVFTAHLFSNTSLECPVVGYPHPDVIWYLNGFPIDIVNHMKYRSVNKGRILRIYNVTEDDFGTYRCVAQNSFAKNKDHKEGKQVYSVSMEMKLEIRRSMGWIYPLILIIIMLCLLCIIIFACKAYSKYKSDNYNVAQREKRYRVDDRKCLAEEV